MSTYVGPVSLRDEATLHDWWDCGRRATADRPSESWPAWEVSRVALPAPDPERSLTLVAAYDADTLVGAGLVDSPLEGNQHVAILEVFVPPEHRGRGVGRLLADEVEERAIRAGRTTLMAEALTWSEGGQTGLRLALARGYVEANTEEVKVLELTDLDPRRSGLEAEAAARQGAYRVVSWQGPTPEEHLPGYGRLLSGYLSEIPLGEVDLQDSEWTPDRIRTSGARDREIGRHAIVAAAIAPDGSLVGFSDLNVNRADARYADVGLTIVDPAHRGRRLGLALKLATHAVLRDSFPGCARVLTCNAGVNEHMNAVNELLGYRVGETVHEMQRKA